jgi:WD40 repeat protein
MDQQQPQQPHPQLPEMLRESSSSLSSGQRQIGKELASLRSSLTNLQRNLLTALNTFNDLELAIMGEAESSGGADLSRQSPPPPQPRHTAPPAATTPGIANPTGYAVGGRKRRRTTPAMPLQRGGSRSLPDHALLGLLPELVLCILAYLDPRSLCQVSLTCTHLKSLADSQPWQALFDQKLGLSWLVLRSLRGRTAGLSWKGHVIEARKVSRKWELGGTQTTLSGHKKAIKNLQFRRNRLLTCDETVIKEWDLETLKLKESFANSDQKFLTFRFDDEKLMVSTADTVRVYEQHTKKLLFDLEDIFSPIVSLRFDSERIWTGAWNGSIALWSARDGKKVVEMSGHSKPIYCMDAQEDLIVTGSSDRWLKVWSSSSCLHTLKGHTKTVQSVQFEGHLVVSSSKDASIRMWDIRSPSPLIAALNGHTADVTCVRFDATKIVSGSADQNIKVWDMRTHKWMYNLVGHSAGVSCLEFTNAIIVSGAEDAEVKVWRFDSWVNLVRED